MQKNKRGFTSIEIMIVLVISSILLIIFAVSRKSQIRAAYLREADVLINDIVNKQKLAYEAKNISHFSDVTSVDGFVEIGAGVTVDARRYLYFRDFKTVEATTSTFKIYVYGKDNTEANGVTIQAKYENGQIVPIVN